MSDNKEGNGSVATVDQEKVAQAGDVLFDEVYVPAFVKRCAEQGIAFSSGDQLKLALDTALRLKEAQAAQVEESNENIHKAANLAIRHMMGEDVDAVEKEAQASASLQGLDGSVERTERVQEAAQLLVSLNSES